MKFEIRHQFDAPVEEVERVLFHSEVAPLLKERMTLILDIQPLESQRSGALLKRKVKYFPKPMIEKVGPKRVEPEWLIWVEDSSYDFTTHTGSYRNVPANGKIAELLHNQGRLELKALPGNRCEQVVSGELTVKVFLLGKVAEPIIKSNATRILDEQARAVQDIIAGKLL